MGSSDFWFAISMAILLATLVVKIFSVASLTSLKKELQILEQRRQNRRKELHRVKNKKDVLNANLAIMKKKKDGLVKRLMVNEKEMEKIAQDEERREERRSLKKVEKDIKTLRSQNPGGANFFSYTTFFHIKESGLL